MSDILAERIRKWWGEHPCVRWLYLACLVLTVASFVTASMTGKGHVWGYLSVFVLLLIAFRPGSLLHTFTMERLTLYKKLLIVLTVIVTIAICVIPMGWFSIWNGNFPGHRNQYELMTEAILDGRIEFAYGDEDELAELDDPYDPVQRQEAGITFHTDHAYYKGHYYMYFGIVPVFLVFLPYRVLTGYVLTAFHATQVFVAFIIVGFFVLFRLLSKLFFKKLPFCTYLAMATAFSVMSVWYSTAEPALYCTAITAAIALEVWSLYFYIRAVWGEQRENRQILFAGIGALLGALVFGCRPPIALANILVIPMLITFLKQRKFSWKLLGKLLLAALPYVIVAAALMWYNYVRFEDPFEFGQRYQLTVANQTQYGVSMNGETIWRVIRNTVKDFLSIIQPQSTFPYIKPRGIFFSFPILLLCIFVFKPAVWKEMGKNRLLPLVLAMFATVLLITAVVILWTPFLLERYRMDIYFLLGIVCFLIVGVWYDSCAPKRRAFVSSAVMILSTYAVVCAFLFCVKTIGNYYPNAVNVIGNALHLK